MHTSATRSLTIQNGVSNLLYGSCFGISIAANTVDLLPQMKTCGCLPLDVLACPKGRKVLLVIQRRHNGNRRQNGTETK